MKIQAIVLGVLLSFLALGSVSAQEAAATILIKNVNVFDGKSDQLAEDLSVLVEGNKIVKVAESISAPDNATVIDGGGRTLTPGFIDTHVHLFWNDPPNVLFESTPDYIASLTLVDARNTLMRGFTTVRDVGGPVLGIKKAIDAGHHVGPRIYASGPVLSMTAGHGDYRFLNEQPRFLGTPESMMERLQAVYLVDGVEEVIRGTREAFRQGAHFIKTFGGGAVSGLRDPLDIQSYSFEEIKAIVDEAERWNTYVAVHAYTDRSIKVALDAGVLSIEHANLITEETMKLLVEKGAFISGQSGFFMGPTPAHFSPAQAARQKMARDGLDNMMTLAKKYNAKMLFGTDFIGDLKLKRLQLEEFTNRTKWYTPAEILAQATSINAEVLELSGPRNPYPDAPLGVIEEGAYADLLLINGNPLEDISILTEPEENLALIMKDGEIYKNTIN